MFTDSSKVKLVDGCVWEVECNVSVPIDQICIPIYALPFQYVIRKQGDIAIDGFNPSAEELDEGTDETSESGYDLVLNQRLLETSFSKADFKNYLKTYTKALQEKWKELEWPEDKVAEAKAKLTEGVKKILPIVGDAQFFMGMCSSKSN